MHLNTIITVYDDGNTNPMVQIHGMATSDSEIKDKFQKLCDDARAEGWKQSASSSTYQYNFVKGCPRKTLTIKMDISSFSFDMTAQR